MAPTNIFWRDRLLVFPIRKAVVAEGRVFFGNSIDFVDAAPVERILNCKCLLARDSLVGLKRFIRKTDRDTRILQPLNVLEVRTAAPYVLETRVFALRPEKRRLSLQGRPIPRDPQLRCRSIVVPCCIPREAGQ